MATNRVIAATFCIVLFCAGTERPVAIGVGRFLAPSRSEVRNETSPEHPPRPVRRIRRRNFRLRWKQLPPPPTPTPTPTVSLTGEPTSLTTSATTSVTATVSNGTGVTWSVTCAASPCGSFSSATAAAELPQLTPSPVRSDLCHHHGNHRLRHRSLPPTLTITTPAPAPISVTLSGQPSSLATSATASITATVSNDSKNGGVTWTVACATSRGMRFLQFRLHRRRTATDLHRALGRSHLRDSHRHRNLSHRYDQNRLRHHHHHGCVNIDYCGAEPHATNVARRGNNYQPYRGR